MVFALPTPTGSCRPRSVSLSGQWLPVHSTRHGEEEVRLRLQPPVTVQEGDVVQVEMRW